MPRAARPKSASGKCNLIGPRVRIRRLNLALTHDAVCGRIALITDGRWIPQRQDIYKIEARVRTCTDIEMVALSQALEIDTAWLLTSDLAS